MAIKPYLFVSSPILQLYTTRILTQLATRTITADHTAGIICSNVIPSHISGEFIKLERRCVRHVNGIYFPPQIGSLSYFSHTFPFLDLAINWKLRRNYLLKTQVMYWEYMTIQTPRYLPSDNALCNDYIVQCYPVICV
jgi:hypothetical protein